MLSRSNLHRKVTGKLVTPYNVMSTFFFRRSVEKAFQMDESPSGLSLNPNRPVDGNPPFIISAVDDVMYIVSAVIQRCLATAQRDVVASVIPTIARVLGSDFIGMIQRKMRDESYPRPLTQGGFPPEATIIAFIVLINSLDVSNDYLTRVIESRLEQPAAQTNGSGPAPHPLAASFPFEHDLKFVTSTLANLNATFTAKTSELLSDGLLVLFNNVVKPRLRPVLSETFRDVDYALTEDELAEIALQNDEDEKDLLDQVPRRFEHGWEALMKPLSRLMTPKTYGLVMDSTAKYLAQALEKRVTSYASRANPYGAIRMERDFTGIVSVVARGNYAAREGFARVTQTLMIINMEEEEWDELAGEDAEEGIDWVLSEDERRRARNLVKEY